ncbi:hypothetical protein RBSH_00278 [Rhodopirellula baltica SH28]|uniref:Uncharacterized protein n=1 Tax=Rhodopirellula baltica SH28 TaxID=993517 RepID=K5DNE7_RHOBT|nr:hypothetical protein RBSH_00278 [Rhodopirellula baltica SH28]
MTDSVCSHRRCERGQTFSARQPTHQIEGRAKQRKSSVLAEHHLGHNFDASVFEDAEKVRDELSQALTTGVLLLDMNISKMHGTMTAKAFRRDRRYQNLKQAVFSGSEPEQSAACNNPLRLSAISSKMPPFGTNNTQKKSQCVLPRSFYALAYASLP